MLNCIELQNSQWTNEALSDFESSSTCPYLKWMSKWENFRKNPKEFDFNNLNFTYTYTTSTYILIKTVLTTTVYH